VRSQQNKITVKEAVNIMDTETITIPQVMGMRIRFSEKALIVRTANGDEHAIPFAQIAPESSVQDLGDRGDLILKKSWAHEGTTIINAQKGGLLFKNDRTTNESAPHYKGFAIIGGREFGISVWVEESKNGKFMSLSFTPKDDHKGASPQMWPNETARTA
jgi:hypothetical protein